jgi:hypothetical protein
VTVPEHLDFCATVFAPAAGAGRTIIRPGIIWACRHTPKSTVAAETRRNCRVIFMG